jgi:hypothetical protein
MRARRTYWEKAGHFSKSAELYPVVVWIETTWKRASRKDFRTSAERPGRRFMVMNRVDPRTTPV